MLLSAAPALALTIDDVTPNSYAEMGGINVTITGTGFEAVPSVTFGGVLTTTLFIDSTTLRSVLPPGTGTVDVAVTNPDMQSATLSNGFTYVPAPTVSGISPGNGPETGGTGVTITGTGFQSGASVIFDMDNATAVSVVDPAMLTCNAPPGNGTVAIMVWNPDGQSGWLFSAFTYDSVPPPTVTGVSPGNGPESGGTSATITGTNFMSGASVKFGGNSASGEVVVSTTELTCTTPSGSGTVDVVVTNADSDSGTLAGGFVYDPPPTVTSVTPANGLEAGGTSVTITGTIFIDGAMVTFGGAAATGVTVTSGTEIACATPAGTGTIDVVVTNPDMQTGTLAGGFAYDPPEENGGGCLPSSGGCSGWLLLLVLAAVLMRHRYPAPPIFSAD